jgi:hypothetical protein
VAETWTNSILLPIIIQVVWLLLRRFEGVPCSAVVTEQDAAECKVCDVAWAQ